jgi:muramoyltetrapeptide carboxypeptidase
LPDLGTRPPRLRPGDVVAVVAPAGPAPPARLAAGVAVLRGWGLDVRVPEVVAEGRASALPWLAGTDAERAAQLTAAWTDPQVRAVWAARGGSGTHRLLDLLDWSALEAAGPRLLVGFSDVTALHGAVAARLGTATLHGPVVTQLGDADPAAVAATRAAVLDGAGASLRGTPVIAGVAEGRLVGGNLTVLGAGSGTPLQRLAAGGVALLEDVDEPPFRLDRVVTQLLRSGWFDDVRGVALGQFTRCGDPALVQELLQRRLEPLGVPVVADLTVGHVPGNLPVGLGVPGRVDGVAGTLTVDPAVT